MATKPSDARDTRFFPGIHQLTYSPLYLVRKELLGVIERFAPKLDGVLLDIGCGSRPYESVFAVQKYVGLDVQESGYAVSEKSPDVYFDGRTIPFCDDRFDSVVASEVFEHVFDLALTLREIRRVLKPGGKLLFTCPFVFPEHEQPYDFGRYTSYGLRHLVKEAGFDVLEEKKSGNALVALNQLAGLYFYQLFAQVRARALSKILCRLSCCFFNMAGVVAKRALPEQWDLYLTNAMLVQRPLEGAEPRAAG